MYVNKKKSTSRELIYGINAVQTAIETNPEKIVCAWIVKGREDDKRLLEVKRMLDSLGIKVQIAMRHTLDEKTDNGVHQGVVIECMSTPPLDEHFLEQYLDEHDKQNMVYLVLDGVTDPRNLGAAMRSAWAFDVTCVIVPKDKSASLTPVARKTADGAAEHLHFIAVTNLARALDLLKDHEVEVVGLAGEAESHINEYAFRNGAVALVMGSEESGLRHLTKEKCDALLRIPMTEGVESLNVSVATGIALYELKRQKMLK
jgi:23S rRNA (guanosine2251-2'-O)-methyltransferase